MFRFHNLLRNIKITKRDESWIKCINPIIYFERGKILRQTWIIFGKIKDHFDWYSNLKKYQQYFTIRNKLKSFNPTFQWSRKCMTYEGHEGELTDKSDDWSDGSQYCLFDFFQTETTSHVESVDDGQNSHDNSEHVIPEVSGSHHCHQIFFDEEQSFVFRWTR